MTCEINTLEICWHLSPPWYQKINTFEASLFERVYLKTNRSFGYCFGIQWRCDTWLYDIVCNRRMIHATKHEIIATGQINAKHNPAFVLGERVMLRTVDQGTRQRLILGIQFDNDDWFYLIEIVSPTINPTYEYDRFSWVAEKDLVKVNV